MSAVRNSTSVFVPECVFAVSEACAVIYSKASGPDGVPMTSPAADLHHKTIEEERHGGIWEI